MTIELFAAVVALTVIIIRFLDWAAKKVFPDGK